MSWGLSEIEAKSVPKQVKLRFYKYLPSAIEVFQGDFEFFKVIEFFKKKNNSIFKKIEIFNTSKFSFQKTKIVIF